MKEQIEQMYLTIKSIGDVLTQEFGNNHSEATQNLEHQLYMLTEIMTPYDVTGEEVRKLRELTGEALLSCRRALEKSRGNQEHAVFILQRGGA